jgi:phage/plasmid primase-like uncharacterized protein
MPRGVQKEAVLAVLSAADVIAYLKIEGRERRGELRTRTCPACGTWGRDAIAINLTTGQWKDHAHGCKGDLLDAIAAAAGLDLRHNFGRVLEIAAVIAGVTADTDPAELARMRAERARLAEQRAAAEKRARMAAIRRAAWIWRRADRWSDRGAEYLAGRGLEPAELARRRLVKFGRDGDPLVALYSSRGQVINVVCRRIAPADDGNKISGLRDAPSLGTLGRSVDQVEPGRLVVIAEGVADTLAASLTWPGAVVLGAHGAGNMPAIGEVLAKRARRPLGEVRIVPHHDKPTASAPQGVGRQAAERTRAELLEGDVPGVELLELEHKDLADAYRAGWRAA